MKMQLHGGLDREEMRVPIRTHTTALLYMQQGYFSQAQAVIDGLSETNPSDPRLDELRTRLEEFRKEVAEHRLEQEADPQPCEVNEESAIEARKESLPKPSVRVLHEPPPRRKGLRELAEETGREFARRALARFVGRLNRVLDRMQEKRRGF